MRLLVVALGVWIAAGGGAVALADVAQEKEKLAAARAKWKAQKIRDYRFRLEIECFCAGEFRGPHTVVVRDGKATRRGGAPKRWDSFTKIFAAIEKDLDGAADEVTATYDARRGFPRRVAVDQIAMAIDDEHTLVISHFKRLRRR